MRDDDGKPGKTVEIAGAAAGAGVGTLLGGPVGGIIGAAITPLLTDLVGSAWSELRGRRESNAVQMVAQAADEAGTAPEELLAAALAEPVLSWLLHEALQAAASTLDEQKVEALARCLANGMKDDARADEEGVIVRALADLDPVHIRVLAKLERRAMAPRDIHVFLCGDIAPSAFLKAPDISGAVLAVLERHGLVTVSQQIEESNGGRYDRGAKVKGKAECTDFGRMCLARLGHRSRRPTGLERFGAPSSDGRAST